MEQTNNQITKIVVACLLTLVGSTLVGLGVGIMIGAVWTYTIIGIGVGFLVSAVIFFNNYNKKTDA